MGEKLLLIGGGGHCKSVLDTILSMETYSDVAIIDLKENIGKTVLGVPIIGSDDDLSNLFDTGYRHAFITLGSIGTPRLRKILYETIREIGFIIPNVIDPSATVSEHVAISEGVFVGKGAIVNAGSTIEACAIINSGAIIEHDCIVGAFAHVAPGATLCGDVTIGNDTHIGANAVVRQGLAIGSNVLIGIGSVVVGDIQDHIIAFGNPCREAK
jgi:sugar O-acyltransferase (sialic acid O-acetyltransferase NeuD family)